MPIEFNCPSCQAKIRTPDNTAGKSARCPKCSTVITIPGGSSPGASTPPPGQYGSSAGGPPRPQQGYPQAPQQGYPQGAPGSAPLGAPPPKPFAAPTPNPLGAPVGNPLGGPPPGTAPNPFGDRAGGAFGPAPVNPYAAPNPAANQGYFQPMQPMGASRERVRPWLLGPAIGMMITGVLGLGFMSMVVLGMAVDPDAIFEQAPQDPAEQAGFYGFFVVYFAGGLITRLIQIIGAIAFFRVRGYSLAMTAAICALLPCDVYCCLLCLPIGIWGLIVLNNPQVKAAYQLP